MSLPVWAKWLIGALIVVVICVVFKLSLTVGYEGIHFTQGLVH